MMDGSDWKVIAAHDPSLNDFFDRSFQEEQIIVRK
jgi:hypothetical protein